MRLLLLLVCVTAVLSAAVARGAGPSAADVAWDLQVPKDPDPADVAFVDGWIAKLPQVDNDSSDMGDIIATLMTAENWPKAFPRLCRALAGPDFNDLYGPSEIIFELFKRGRTDQARRLFPFVIKASERVAKPEDLAHMTLAAMRVRDRKAVPRLIELLASQDADVKEGAVEALKAITGLAGADAITPERMQAWWNANWSRPQADIYAEQLKSGDPDTAIEAAAGLCELRDASIFPVLFKLLRNPEPEVGRHAIEVVKRATGRDWAYDPGTPPEVRGKRVDMMEKWWKEERLHFNWPGLPRQEDAAPGAAAAAAAPVDPALADVNRLGADKASDVAEGERNLRAIGLKSVPALIEGLGSASLMVRRRSYDILRDIAHQDIAFDPRVEGAPRREAIEAWRAWAMKAKLIVDGGAAADDDAPAPQGSGGSDPGAK